jgi:hypothetical protein
MSRRSNTQCQQRRPFDEAHRPIRDFHLNNQALNPASANVTDSG